MSRGKKQITREDILAVTRRLFTQSGYDNVKLRDIAAELGISLGNLQYYYKSKAELVEAAIIDKHQNARKWVPVSSLRALDVLFLQTQEMQREHLYFFRQYTQLSQISEDVEKIHIKVFDEMKDIWQKTMSLFFDAGLVVEEDHPAQYETCVETILFLSAYWHEKDLSRVMVGIKTPSCRHAAWSVLYPMLTSEGKRIYRNEIEPRLSVTSVE